MTTNYIRIIVDPSGDNYNVPAVDLMDARVVMPVNTPGTFEFTIHNPAGARNSLYEMDDKVDIYVSPHTNLLKGWTKRVKITIDNTDIDAALSDFPVLVYLSASSGRNSDDVTFVFDEVGANSLKIAVTEADGTTECYVEVEKWDFGNEKAWLWVKVPAIASGADTDIYLYFDNNHADNNAHVGVTNSVVAENVWDDNFLMVQHQAGAASPIRDSTSNNVDMTEKSDPIYQQAGQIDGAIDYDENDCHFSAVDVFDAIVGTGKGTISFWIKTTTETASLNHYAFSIEGGYAILFNKLDNDGKLRIHWSGTGADFVKTNTVINDGNWHYVVTTYDGANQLAYVAGNFENTDVCNLADITGFSRASRITTQWDWSAGLAAVIDEVRVSKIDRSPSWIKASYESGRDHLNDFGSEDCLRVMTGTIEEIEITRPEFGQNTLTCRGQDYLTVLAYRLARVSSQGTVNIGDILINLVTEFASGEFTTNNVSGGVYTQTDFTVGTRTSLLTIMRKLAELPSGDSFDFYIDGSNDIHWHLRGDAAYDSGVTLSGSNIRGFTSRRSVKDKKTFIWIQGAQTPKEETASTHNTVTDSVTLDANHYADDFIAEHNNIMRVELYIQKVGSPGVDFAGRVALSKHGDPTGDFQTFTIREEEVGGSAGWHTVPMDFDTVIGARYFIKVDRMGDDVSNTYKWYGDTPAVIDTENTAAKCVATSGQPALLWVASDYDFSMKVHYGEFVEVSASNSATPKREAVVRLPRAVDEATAQALADRLLEIYLATSFYASIVVDAPSAELKPGDLITLNETGSGLASKTYRMERIDWEFGARGKSETVALDISSELPYESLTELNSRILEELMGASGSQLESGATEGAEPDIIGRSTIGRSLVSYVPG